MALGLQPVKALDFKWKRIEILDGPGENIKKHFDETNEFIKEGIERGGVLVHCFAGVSRSTSCVIAYLMKEKGFEFWNALNFVRSRRSIICPNMGFMR